MENNIQDYEKIGNVENTLNSWMEGISIPAYIDCKSETSHKDPLLDAVEKLAKIVVDIVDILNRD